MSETKPEFIISPISEPKHLGMEDVANLANQIIANVERVIVGKHDQIVLAVATLFSEGHLLIQDVPGVAKTMLARALAHSAGCSFKRIQCTPDLQPLDVLGGTIVNTDTGQNTFRFGPLFSQFVLIDEINRASPRTQAAMLEAMGEGMITSENVTYRLERPFMVVATQNPIEQEGVYPLPEAQKDRFLIQLTLGYPSLRDEKEMCELLQIVHPIDTIKSVTTPDRIVACQQAVREVAVADEVCDYVLALVRATRERQSLLLGASPRASLGLIRLIQAMTAIQGGGGVSMVHVGKLAVHVLGHRIIVKANTGENQRSANDVIEEILREVQPDQARAI
jgi:MoxR-like ATPase